MWVFAKNGPLTSDCIRGFTQGPKQRQIQLCVAQGGSLAPDTLQERRDACGRNELSIFVLKTKHL